MATAKKAAKPKSKAQTKKPVVRKKATKPPVKKKAAKPAIKKAAVKKKASKPAVRKTALKTAARKRPAAGKQASASSASNARVKTLQASIGALKKQILGLKNEVRAANRRADALGRLSGKRGAAIARFVSGWDRKANAAAVKSARPKKKK